MKKPVGLFSWAATACRFIGGGENLRLLKKDSSLSFKTKALLFNRKMKLNNIYIAVLRNSISDGYASEENENLYDILMRILESIVYFPPFPPILWPTYFVFLKKTLQKR